MRIPSNLIFFIDDCHISAMIVPTTGSNRAPIMTSEKVSPRDFDSREKITLSLLNELCKDIRDWSSKHEFRDYKISSTKVVLSPSWYLSQTSVVSKESPKPILFTEDYIFKTISDELPENTDSAISKKDLLLIEKSVSHIFLNGYPILGLNDKKATTCKATVYYCYMSKSFNRKIVESIGTIPSAIDNLSFHSLAKINLDYSKTLLHREGDSVVLKSGNVVIVNFCSYITEIIYLHSETNLNILSLPIGHKETVHKMNEKTGSEISATESLLDLFVENKLKPESRTLVGELLERMGRDWVKSVMQGINQLPNTPDSVTKLFVFGEDKRQVEIAKIFARLLPFNTKSEVEVTLFNDILANKESVFK